MAHAQVRACATLVVASDNVTNCRYAGMIPAIVMSLPSKLRNTKHERPHCMLRQLVNPDCWPCAPLRPCPNLTSPSCNQNSSATPTAHAKSEGSQGSTPLITAVIGGWGITWDDVLSWVWLSFSHWRSRLASLAVTGQTQVRFLVVTVLSVLTIVCLDSG